MEHQLKFLGLHIPFFNYELVTLASPFILTQKASFFIIAVLLLLILLSVRKDKKTELLDTKTTDQIRGIAILGIILMHYLTNVTRVRIDQTLWVYVESLGKMGVGAFLFLSGFGLTISYLKDGIFKYYLPKRLMRVLLPYWTVSLIIIFLDVSLLHTLIPVKYVALNLAGILFFIDGTKNLGVVLWYVTYISLLYIIFYLIFILKVSNRLKVAFLFTFAVLTTLIYSYVPGTATTYIQFWAIYSLYFPFGALLALNFKALKSKFEKLPALETKIIILVALLVTLTYGYFTRYQLVDNNQWDIYLSGYIFVFVLIFVSLFKLRSRFLLFIGSISYELYLVHSVFMEKFDFFLFRKTYYISFFVYLAFIVLLSYIISKFISSYLASKISKRLFASNHFKKLHNLI